MNLVEMYRQISEQLTRIDFEQLWSGFKPLKFALYNDTECYFDGTYIEKTVDFCANTAIKYQGEYIAIWNLEDDIDIRTLTSKIVHEMFHAFQMIHKWDCFANEMEALIQYHYDEVNLSMKLHENELLLSLADHFEQSKYEELIASRKYRSSHFSYEYKYESCVEEIEGTANYVEWMVLQQLAPDKAINLFQHMRDDLIRPEYFFPIRVSCYLTGALIIYVAMKAGDYCFTPQKRPYGIEILKKYSMSEKMIDDIVITNVKVMDAICNFHNETDLIIESSLKANEVLLSGPFELKGVNIYDARYRNGYITSRYFVMYAEGNQDKVIQGNFVIKLDENNQIDKVYRWPSENN